MSPEGARVRATLWAATMLGAIAFPTGAAAQQTDATANGTTSAPQADPVAEEARARYRRGIELFDEGDYRLALVELERAYAIVPSYKVLYNIGQVHFQLNEYAKARTAFETYLQAGGAEIPPARRAEVERDLATLANRIATITIEVNVPAEVTVNGEPLGRSPISGRVVDAGVVRIQAASAGYMQHSRVIKLAGGDSNKIRIDLVRASPDVVVSNHGLSGLAVASWIATGVFAAGAVGTGLAASSASSRYDEMRSAPIAGSPEEASADLKRQRGLVNGLALTTDILAGVTLVGAGASLYFTFWHRPKPDAPNVRLQGTAATFNMKF